MNDIAQKYGYDSHTAFYRTFQAVHGISTTQASKQRPAQGISAHRVSNNSERNSGNDLQMQNRSNCPMKTLGMRPSTTVPFQISAAWNPAIRFRTVTPSADSAICILLTTFMKNSLLLWQKTDRQQSSFVFMRWSQNFFAVITEGMYEKSEQIHSP